jgi:hypothetical protein
VRCQPHLGWSVVIRWGDVRDVAAIKLACLSIEFRKIVLIGLQVIGSARVHRWTSLTDPPVFSYEGQNLRKINFWALERPSC